MRNVAFFRFFILYFILFQVTIYLFFLMILVLVIYNSPGNKCIITQTNAKKRDVGLEDELRWFCDGRGHLAELTRL